MEIFSHIPFYRMPQKMNFAQLVKTIKQTHDSLKLQAVKAVNISLTLRNWLIGYYIAEYQLKGSDRASYGRKNV
jgi:hypothetical protein